MRRRRAQARSRLGIGADGLMLAAMVDMMVNLLIFMLHLYGTDPSSGSADSLELATATATEGIAGTVVLVVRTDAVIVNGDRVADLTALDRDELLFETLKARGEDAKRRAEDKGETWDGRIVLQVDRRIPWPDLRSLLRIAGRAGFWNLNFVVASASELPSGADLPHGG